MGFESKPCLEYMRSFSADREIDKVPSYLSEIYESVFPLISKLEHFKSLKRSADYIIKLFKDTPFSLRFNSSKQKSVIKALKNFKGSKKDILSLSGKLLEATNAIDLDWRVPPLPKKQLKIGKNITVDFQGVAWITFKKVKEAGVCSLSIKGHYPALVKGFEIGWPIASYHFDFKGKLEDTIDISFYMGGISSLGSYSSPRILEYDGKSYRDITIDVDYRRRVIIGRTNKLSTYVIMNAKPKGQIKVEKRKPYQE